MTKNAVGFIGLGVMGFPMALNLLRSGQRLIAWNRSEEKIRLLEQDGAEAASSPREVFERAPVVIVMLADDRAIDDVLGRGTSAFAMVNGRTIVNMGTTAPAYSEQLANDVRAAGGRYVEAPVSGSRKPAEGGQLVGMLAGDEGAVHEVRPLLAPMCSRTFVCGPVPQALRMKLSVNLFLITMVAGLAEATQFAKAQGLELQLLAEILDSGPMASSVSRMKLQKLVSGDYSVQASIRDVAMNSSLVADAARASGTATPLLDVTDALFAESVAAGRGSLDMAAVVHAIAERERPRE